MNSKLRSLPSVEKLLEDPRLGALAGAYSRPSVAGLVRKELDVTRDMIRGGGDAPPFDSLVTAVESRAATTLSTWPVRVINATGVIVHTNLGRAPLSQAASQAAAEAGAGYSDLEISLASGKRGSRYTHISELLAQITGADAGIVVNNNAAAVMLVLTALGAGREVVVSRGEAVEIGGGFRIPDVLRQSGATLVEVGTTNRTYARDFEAVAGDNTSAFLKVHASNFRVTGFTAEPSLAEMVEVGDRHGIPVLHDLGSGALLDTAAFGMATEPMVQQSVSDGAGLAMFSGDKLLGGPQAGIIVGKADLVKLIAGHPMARALRVEKVSLAALSATLIPYLKGTATEEIPVWQMISATAESLAQRGKAILDSVDGLSEIAELRESRSAVGGGSLPGETLPSTVVAVSPPADAESFLAALRSHSPPVIARIEKDNVLLDPRTMLPGEDALVAEALAVAIRGQ